MSDGIDLSKWVTKGEALYDQSQDAVHPALSKLLRPGNIISADEMRAAWFPTLRADVFISHSHSDAETAKGLVGWLNDTWGRVGRGVIGGFSSPMPPRPPTDPDVRN